MQMKKFLTFLPTSSLVIRNCEKKSASVTFWSSIRVIDLIPARTIFLQTSAPSPPKPTNNILVTLNLKKKLKTSRHLGLYSLSPSNRVSWSGNTCPWPILMVKQIIFPQATSIYWSTIFNLWFNLWWTLIMVLQSIVCYLSSLKKWIKYMEFNAVLIWPQAPYNNRPHYTNNGIFLYVPLTSRLHPFDLWARGIWMHEETTNPIAILKISSQFRISKTFVYFRKNNWLKLFHS